MIVNNNICTQIGDAIFMQTVPILGLSSVNSITDSTTGEYSARSFDRKVAYSIDMGVTFTDWFDLDNSDPITSLNALIPTNIHQIVFNFLYTRQGTDNTGEIVLNQIYINGIYAEPSVSFPISSQGMFADLVYNNINVMNMVTNLTQKMYQRGIVPLYITRGEEEGVDLTDDTDYIDFWEAVATFYSVIYIDSIKFENIYWTRSLICEYLRQKGVFYCNCNDITQLQLIAQNFFNEIRVRGTAEVFTPEGFQYPWGNRLAYVVGSSFTIEPNNPVIIDGITYQEVSTLPFGWTVNSNLIISPDMNYHNVQLFNGTEYVQITETIVQLSGTSSGILKNYDGEYLRLICYNSCDEFLYNNVPTTFVGWNMDRSSPMYKGLRPQLNPGLVKAYELAESVVDLTKYPVVSPDNVYIAQSPSNPLGVPDTVMYMSYSGQKCFPIPPVLYSIINAFELYINYSAENAVSGLVILTNLETSDVTQIPINLTGNKSGLQTFEISSGLVPSTYSVRINFTFKNSIAGSASVGAVIQNFSGVNNTFDQTYNFTNVSAQLLVIQLNFSL